MKKVFIPNSDLKVSSLCLGTFPLGLSISEQESFAILDAFFNEGGNFIDTAYIYGRWIKGTGSDCASEKVIGKWIKDRGIRKNIVLGTKGGSINLDTGKYQSSKQEILMQIDNSLRNLHTDYIDIYWLHRDDIERSVEHYIDLLNEQVNLGKIRFFGCSNWTINRIISANQYAKLIGQKGFIANQPWWSLAKPNEENVSDKTMIWLDKNGYEFHKQSGMALVPYSSQAKGFFSKIDKYGIDSINEDLQNLYINERNLAIYKKIQEITACMGITVNDAALSYMLSQPFTTIPIIGCKNISQIKESVKAAEVVLTKEMISALMID